MHSKQKQQRIREKKRKENGKQRIRKIKKTRKLRVGKKIEVIGVKNMHQ